MQADCRKLLIWVRTVLCMIFNNMRFDFGKPRSRLYHSTGKRHTKVPKYSEIPPVVGQTLVTLISINSGYTSRVMVSTRAILLYHPVWLACLVDLICVFVYTGHSYQASSEIFQLLGCHAHRHRAEYLTRFNFESHFREPVFAQLKLI